MKILVFGSNGYLGKNLTLLLKKHAFEFYTVSRSFDQSEYKIDISNFEDFSILPLNFFDVIINCATVLPGGDYLDNNYLDKIYKTNVLGSQNICKWIGSQNSIKKIINTSTLVVVGKPWALNFNETAQTYPTGNHILYCSSKLTQELLFKTFADKNNILLSQIRFSSLYGSKFNNSGIIHNLITNSKVNKKITLTNATKVSADFLHVTDAARIIIATIDNDLEGIINGAIGVETTILKLAETIKECFENKIEIKNSESKEFKTDRAIVNVNKLNKIIDTSSFVTLKTGIQEMVNL